MYFLCNLQPLSINKEITSSWKQSDCYGAKTDYTLYKGIFGMMTSSSGNIFRVTGPLWGEFTDHRWIPFTKASDAGFWYFLWSVPEQTVEQTIETLMI